MAAVILDSQKLRHARMLRRVENEFRDDCIGNPQCGSRICGDTHSTQAASDDCRIVLSLRPHPVIMGQFLKLWRTKMSSVAKITEISASSSKSFADAMDAGISRASKTLKNISGAWINEMKVDVKDGKITAYRVNMKVTFVLDD